LVCDANGVKNSSLPFVLYFAIALWQTLLILQLAQVRLRR
jgi:hypothetical protein